ncbi:MAG: RNA pseudouridine synthase [Planctomycetaceae bacterium]|nr:RNA pseudouridine synthase [Planctomycetaceae bacterium]
METQEPASPIPAIAVLHEEPSWLVVAKPAGIHSIAQRGSDAPSVEAWLRAARPELEGLEEAGLVHRLDFETSGCLLVAKDGAVRERLREAFSGRGGDIRKTYLALVEGRFADRVLAGAFTLSFTSRHKGSAKVTVHTRGEPETIGRCRWRVLRVVGAHTLVEVELLGPGRRHQIRAGMAHEGHPLVGDTLYGASPSAGGLCLHAHRLAGESLVGPEGGAITAPAPAWLPASGPSGAPDPS